MSAAELPAGRRAIPPIARHRPGRGHSQTLVGLTLAYFDIRDSTYTLTPSGPSRLN